jgi:dTDP-4-dehydrorhamnose reductase
MRILVLGGEGMLGHKAFQIFSRYFDTYVTFRSFDPPLKHTNIFDEKKIIDKIDAFEFDSIKKAISLTEPNIVINCIGIIKQLKEVQNRRISIYINSLFPHLLVEYCTALGSKLIHISTDCVFSGKKGHYTEDDVSDAEDIYGKTKYLGELDYGNSLTIRTSIIGHELFSHVSLVDWFLSQKNKVVTGYKNAIYTGFPTITLCYEIVRLINNYPQLTGLFHVSSEKISKFNLLSIIKKNYKINVTIKPDEDYHCDRSLNSEKYMRLTNFHPQPWEEMIHQMHEDYLNYKYRIE